MQAKSFVKIVLALQIALLASTAHASVAVQCTAPGLVQCVVSEPQGIRKITVRSGSTTVLVDNSYSCVSTATVAFDGAARSSELEVTTCGADGVAPKPAGGYGDTAYTYSISNGVIRRDESAGALDIPRPGLVYAARYPLLVADLASHVRQVLQLPALLIGYVSAGAHPVPATYYCCTEGTHAQCVPVNPLALCGVGLEFLACDDNGQNCKVYPN